jgi:hypothetical protein
MKGFLILITVLFFTIIIVSWVRGTIKILQDLKSIDDYDKDERDHNGYGRD